MRRSRPALLLFLATFSASLLAVGFADGRHQSAGNFADFHHFELDEVADCWDATPCAPVATFTGEQPATACKAEPPPAISSDTPDSMPGSSGWIVLLFPSSPLGLVLYVDEETACSLTCPDMVAEAVSLSPADLALATAARFGDPLLAQLVWPCAVNVESYRIAEWTAGNNFADFPDCSLTGWVDEANLWATAETWRTIGRAAYSVAEQLIRGRDLVTSLTSRQIMAWLRPLAVSATQAAAGTPHNEPEAAVPNIGHINMPFLTL